MNSKIRIVFKPSIARKLVKSGYKVVDIRPQKQINGEIDFTRCTFVFQYKDGIDEIINNETTKPKQG